MPGAARHRFQFKDETPSTVVITTVLFANFAFSFGTAFWIEHFAPRHPTGSFLLRFNIRPESAAFVPKSLATYQSTSLWIGFGVLAIHFLLCPCIG